jgi:flagellar hook-length control protein FliK
VAVIAANAASSKATHLAQGAQSPAVPAEEAALFAELLAKAGDAKGETKSDDPEALLSKGKAGAKSSKDSKDKGTPETMLPTAMDISLPPTQLAVLAANLSSNSGQPPTKPDAANDNSNAVSPADAAKDAASDATLLNRSLDAKDTKASAKSTPAKEGKDDDVAQATASPDAAPVPAPMANVPDNTETKPSDKTKAVSTQAPGAVAAAQTAAQAKVLAKDAITVPGDNQTSAAGDPATAANDDKKKADDKSDAKNAVKDAAVQAATSDKADALASAADKSVRQNAASQGAQARVAPVQVNAQAPAGQDTGQDSGSNNKSQQHTAGASTKHNANAQPPANAVQPATPALINAVQSAQHLQAHTDNVQAATPQVQTQISAPAVAASLHVAPQATLAMPQPDLSGLAVQIATKSDEGAKHFDIRLDPPELGRVDVKLSIDNSGQTQAHLTVEKPQTLNMLQNDRNGLERALKDCGLNLSQSGLNFSLKGQERQQDGSQSFRGRSRSFAVSAVIEATSVAAAAAATTNTYGTGDARLDIRV